MKSATIIARIMALAGRVKKPRRYRAYLQRLQPAKLEQRLSDLSADALQHPDAPDYGRGKRLVIKHPGVFDS